MPQRTIRPTGQGVAEAPATYLGNANAAQQQAITATEGPVLIIAGPGSGKTFTLVERIVHLITHKGVTPESMLVVTFTDKAARELTTRVSNRLNELKIPFNLNEMYLGTFHSICLRIVDEHREYTRLKKNFTLFDQFDQQYFLYRKLKEFDQLDGADLVIGREDTGRWARSERLMNWLNKVTEEALPVETLLTAKDKAVVALGYCLQRYHELLDENNALDFSGIQYEALHLLEGQPKVLAQLRETLKYLMVDEYQDTNTIQEKILTLLMGRQKNLCVVGDDDQGLYRFRGATIRNILEFPGNFKKSECQQVTLKTNYRSHPDIISFYNRWMSDQEWEAEGKRFRYGKVIEAQDKPFPEVPAALRMGAAGEDAWHAEVLAFLNRLKSSKKLSDWNQVAFLFKSVKSDKVVALAGYLEAHGIPVYSPRSNMFFDREEIRLMLGALIFLFPQYPLKREHIPGMTLPIWAYLDDHCFAPFAAELRKPENKALLDWARPLAKKHLNLAQSTDYAFSGLFYQMLQFPLFSRYLSEGALTGPDKGRAARNLATLSGLLAKYEHLNSNVFNPEWIDINVVTFFNSFLRFLKDGGIDEYEDDSEYAPSGCVSFLTIHQSKGLEFPVVVVSSLEAVPRKQYTDLDELLEHNYFSKPPFEPLEQTKFYDFWRLYYTAFSRAQNLLVLATQIKTGHGRSPSKYFDDYFNELPDWRDKSFKPEKMSFELVREINLKRQYSFTSHITLFERCAEQYRFFKELEFHPIRAGAQLFGTLVHQTIEDIHKAVLRGEEKTVNPDRIADWFASNYTQLSKRERQYLAPMTQQAALGHVQRYYEREKDSWDRIKEAEVEISLVKDDYILHGAVDLIRGENDTVEIIDFKSEQKPDLERDRERLRQYQRQLEIYAHLVEERTGQTVSRMHLYYTGEKSGNPYVSFEKDHRSIGKTIAVFDEVVRRIECRDYSMSERPAKLCTDCDMKAFCDSRNWKFRSKS